jgi:hypothetical protein
MQRYREYRRVGYGRLAALQFAWMVTSTGRTRRIPAR